MRKRFLFATFVLLSIYGLASPVKLYCWIVNNDRGESPHSEVSISNQLISLNRIYSQVGMSFSVESISYTNCTRLTNVNYTNDVQNAELCGLTNGTDGLEVYFVKSITHGVDAFHWASGIVVGEGVNDTTLAHEIGHACGLEDIYISHVPDTDLVVMGMPEKNRFTHDWGWYPENTTQSNVIERLLMYGYNTDSAHKCDISRGDVYGLWYQYVPDTTNKVWQLGLTPVGFKLHGNRHPVSE